MDKVREDFEKWARREGVAMWPHPNARGKYYCGAAQKAWEAWKASRECLVIAMPDGDPGEVCPQGLAFDECREAIHAAGVRTK